MRIFLLTAAVLCAVMAVGLVWGWTFWVFDERGWRQHSTGWLSLSLAFFAASCHPWAEALDRAMDGRASR